jgi:hypothetical protein
MSEGDASGLAEPTLGPAAHSMDTDWFAVDALGHVGVFESGEGGGVPDAHFREWESQSSFDELLERLLGEPTRAGLRFDEHELFAPDRRDHPWDRYSIIEAPEQLGDRSSALVELADASVLADPHLREGLSLSERFVRLPSDRVLIRGWFDPTILAGLWHELGVIRVRSPYDLEPGRFGLFRYSCDDYSAGPYARVERPRGQPLRIEQLSAPLRTALSGVTFSALDFRSEAVVQPFEHVPSQAWGHEWLGTDGQLHSVE